MAFKITSQFARGSEKIKANYFKINDWQQASLSKQSWIDTNIGPLEFPAKMVTIPFGRLTEKDRVRFHDFLSKHSNKKV
ncbi:hypothetical protein [Loigolactobacillus iwatensis]|uniref:hypothetical protein n=1 Tax=Loigolactobacillus iwatensis TaxID=1267156 RepID=UPI000F7ED7F4|nr:hypothetical protein [Loigolactobacillus iwatensis]